MIKTKKSGQLIVISAPSGCGKGSVIEGLQKRNKNLYLSISTTTRPIRKNDIPGVTYNFVTKEDFEKKIDENYFLEYTNYVGNYYGTPKEEIKKKLDEGLDVILEIEIEGAKKIKELVPEAIFIFILPPSLKDMVIRLKKRGTDSNEKILKRFSTAYKEINEITKYNYVVVNDILEDAVDKVDAIIKAEKCRVDRIEEVFVDTKEEEIHELLMEDDKNFENKNISEKLN